MATMSLDHRRVNLKGYTQASNLHREIITPINLPFSDNLKYFPPFYFFFYLLNYNSKISGPNNFLFQSQSKSEGWDAFKFCIKQEMKAP